MLSKSVSPIIDRLSHRWLSIRLSVRLPIGWLHWLHWLHWDGLAIWHRLRIISWNDDSGSLVVVVVVHGCHLCLELFLLFLTIAITSNSHNEDDSKYCSNNGSGDSSGAGCLGLIVIPALVVVSRTVASGITAVVVAILIVAV